MMGNNGERADPVLELRRALETIASLDHFIERSLALSAAAIAAGGGGDPSEEWTPQQWDAHWQRVLRTLDWLVATWALEKRKLFSEATIMDLIVWTGDKAKAAKVKE